MSFQVENTADEILDLVGATILDIAIIDDPDGIEGDVVRLRVSYRTGLAVNGSGEGVYQIWQDPEGNGPGFIAYMGPPS